MTPSKERVAAGQAVYSPTMLSIYDIIVLGISNSFIWKCPSARIEDHYNSNISANHLDVGVGTGYFLDRCCFPVKQPRVGLMDMNPNTLQFASKRIARYAPETYQQNILERIEGTIEPYDSVGINYLFHCVPGAIAEKASVFDNLKVLMNPSCRVFGSTLLQGGVSRSWAAKKLMTFYNNKGVFSNVDDCLEQLQGALTQRFDDVQLKVVGCVALFSGQFR